MNNAHPSLPGWNALFMESCPQSMEWARANIASLPDCSALLAQTLESAQGRDGRVWEVRNGQLLATMIFKPTLLTQIAPQDRTLRLNQFLMAIAAGICTPLQHFGVILKWPNDFVIGSKKVGGILSTLVWKGDHPEGIIVGLGLNVTTPFSPEDPLSAIATNLCTQSCELVDLNVVTEQVLASVLSLYHQWCNQQFASIFSTWKYFQAFLGQMIAVHTKDGQKISGVFHSLLENGDIILQEKNGNAHTLPFYMIQDVFIE